MSTDADKLYIRTDNVQVSSDISDLVQKLLADKWGQVAVEKETMTIDTESNGYTFRTIIFNISGLRSANSTRRSITSVEGVVLVRMPPKP